MRRALLASLFFLALVALWQVAVQSNRWSPVLLPPPRSVAEYLWGALLDGSLLEAGWVTMRRLLIGYLIGVLLGLPLGLLISTSRFFDDTICALALGLQTCRACAGSRSPCFGSDRPRLRCCSSLSWVRCGPC